MIPDKLIIEKLAEQYDSFYHNWDNYNYNYIYL